jgi:hypothetical protein
VRMSIGREVVIEVCPWVGSLTENCLGSFHRLRLREAWIVAGGGDGE